ncbi:hypothetical protein BaRGS_00014142 [Batillaria attramentaria]|uniref:Uncharacterized protein n=1 Tax=Batillaria attramentaria TaxID=370345 RepID=A0ABD0L581_9CAEN
MDLKVASLHLTFPESTDDKRICFSLDATRTATLMERDLKPLCQCRLLCLKLDMITGSAGNGLETRTLWRQKPQYQLATRAVDLVPGGLFMRVGEEYVISRTTSVMIWD